LIAFISDISAAVAPPFPPELLGVGGVEFLILSPVKDALFRVNCQLSVGIPFHAVQQIISNVCKRQSVLVPRFNL
jgi:hypothetical protein